MQTTRDERVVLKLESSRPQIVARACLIVVDTQRSDYINTFVAYLKIFANYYSLLTVSDSVSVKNLTLIKWTDPQGKLHKLRIVQSICPQWRTIGNLLDISDSVLESILSQYRGNLEECCYAVLRRWLDNGSPDYPLTWEGLLELLADIDCSQVSEELRDALNLNAQ